MQPNFHEQYTENVIFCCTILVCERFQNFIYSINVQASKKFERYKYVGIVVIVYLYHQYSSYDRT